jgi:deoxyribonuclease V
MIVCFDVQYDGDTANAAAILFEDWHSDTIVDQLVVECSDIEPYQPGSFYQRELKPLRAVLQLIACPIDCYVIDAYCHLSADRSPGLGAYFQELLSEDSIVVGVAKNRFRDTNHAVEVLRGESGRPQFVTSIGVDYVQAANDVQSMVGPHRIPTMLKAVDRLCRDRSGSP